jgi:hypothetical protein
LLKKGFELQFVLNNLKNSGNEKTKDSFLSVQVACIDFFILSHPKGKSFQNHDVSANRICKCSVNLGGDPGI